MRIPGVRTSHFLPVFLLALAGLQAVEIDPQKYLGHVKYLASEDLGGRGTGTKELDQAAEYIARQFREFGLQPAISGSYFQPFPVTTNAKLGPMNEFGYEIGGAKTKVAFEADFIPFNSSSAGRLSGEVIFAGYGITAPEYNYDDYAGLDVKGKIVLILRHEPQELDEKSVFAGKVFTEHAQLFSKASNAKMHGASGVVMVNDLPNHPGESDALEKFVRAVGPNNAGVPYVHVKAEVAKGWFAQAGQDLEEIQKAIDQDLKPRSFAFPLSLRLHFNVDVEREIRTVRNVAAYLPGETDEYLVIGAHYDHLGLGEHSSMAPSLVGTPHLGADDNASGTAGLLELARWFGSQPKRKRGVFFLAFAGEELGLLGSSYYVNHPALPLEQAVAMMNMDMIGRVRDHKVYIGGTGTGSVFQELLKEPVAQSGLAVDFTEKAGYGSSDHTSFTTKQVPVLFFFSGLHGDYHRPSDTWDKIAAPEAARLVEMVGVIGEKLLSDAARPEFVRVADPRAGRAVSSTGGGAGYGAYFGSIPDFTELPNGVRFADVREGSPAAQAGLKGGDILTEFDGKPIQNLYDFTYALRSKKPGETVAVKVLRDNQPLEVKVTLGQRK